VSCPQLKACRLPAFRVGFTPISSYAGLGAHGLISPIGFFKLLSPSQSTPTINGLRLLAKTMIN